MSEHKKITIDTYNLIAADYSARDMRSDVDEAPFVYRAINEFAKLLPSNGYILDVGFGGGRDARYLNRQGFRVTGIDNAYRMVEIAKTLDPNSEYLLMDFESIEFPEVTFDGIWANASLHHIPKNNLPIVLGAILKILKKHGYLRILIKSGQDEGLRTNMKFNRKINRYFAFYNRHELTNIVSNAGFDVITCKTENENEWLNLLAIKK